MLTIGLMLAGCGSTETHVRNRHVAVAQGRDVERDVVDAICACP
jgi:hypothetical protein